MTTVVITMAGRGSRFRDAGFDVAKYEIVVHGRTLFAWSLLSLSSWLVPGTRVVLVARREDAAAAFVARECALLGIDDWALVQLDATTDGQATTVLAAEPEVTDPDAPVLIYNIDTHVQPAALDAARARGAGWIPTFPGEGSAWSFARADEHDRVLEVREKERISPDATVGLYWFASFTLYRDLYDEATRTGRGVQAGERYVAPLYDLLLARGEPVYLERLPLTAVVPLGTPADVAAFAAQQAPDPA